MKNNGKERTNSKNFPIDSRLTAIFVDFVVVCFAYNWIISKRHKIVELQNICGVLIGFPNETDDGFSHSYDCLHMQGDCE